MLDSLPRKVRIEDIATRAGVTKATVSLALRDRSGVSETMRSKIKTLAVEMGYAPDPALSALASYRMTRRPPSNFNIVPFLTNYESPECWIKEVLFYRALYQGARDCGEKLGYSVENFWMKQARSERITQILKARGIRGLLLAPTTSPVGHLRLDWNAFSSVALSFSVARPLTHYAVPNMYQGMSLLWHHVWHLGYRRPGLAVSEAYNRRGRYRWLASHLIEQKIRLPAGGHATPLIFPEKIIEKKTFVRWFRKERPDVIFCVQPDLVVGYLSDIGKSVPDDVGVASLEVFEPDSPWSGINQNPYEIGVAAIEMLNSLIMIGECGIPAQRRGLFVEATWHEGKTLRNKKPQKSRP